MRYRFKKINNKNKILIISVISILIVLATVVFPTFARLHNRTSLMGVTEWDGITVATSYRKGNGSLENPYVISNGAELAFFEKQLETKNYEDKYFTLNTDIIINKGKFSYSEELGLLYILDKVTYYVNEENNKYYEDSEFKNEIGSINIIDSLDNFKGTFNGNFHTIYGFYMNDKNKDNAALFTNLEGAINNLYVDNIYVKGGINTAGLVSNAENTAINNVIVNGNIFNRNDNFSQVLSTKQEDIELIGEQSLNINLINNHSVSGLTIDNQKLTGNISVTNVDDHDYILEINGITYDSDTFELELLGSNIQINVITDSETIKIDLTNLNYNIELEKATIAGIGAHLKNSTINNVANKANIYGKYNAGGLIAEAVGEIEINNSYNKGNIVAENVSAGLIATIENNNSSLNINNSYNTGDTEGTYYGGLVGIINNINSAVINDSVHAGANDYLISSVINTNVTADNTYYINGLTPINNGTYEGLIFQKSLEELSNNDYFKENLGYSEYVNKSDLANNSDNLWVYEKNELPILYFDDISNPIASIHAGIYSWNNYSNELNKKGFRNSISFSIENIDELNPYTNAYYTIESGTNINPLTKDELLNKDWILFDGIITLEEESEYIIYAKIEKESEVQYINSDLLVLDNNAPIITMEMDNNIWQEFIEEPDEFVLDRTKNLTISATDDLSGIDKIEYYISEEALTYTQIEELSELNYKEYDEPILIDDVGKVIVYAKTTDISGNISYANSSIFLLDGYIQSDIYPGTEKGSNLGNYITNKSSITIETSYNNEGKFDQTYSHNLKTNVLLPKNTKITLIDFVLNKVYTYAIPTENDEYGYDENNYATYPLVLFNEVGTINNQIKYVENSYEESGKINEEFTITFDFSNALMGENLLDVQAYLEVCNAGLNTIRPTLYDQIKPFNVIIDNNDAPLVLETDYKDNVVELNSNSQTKIGFTSKLDYLKFNENTVYNTKYELMKIGLGIKLLDSDGNIVTKDKMSNMIFVYKDKEYYPDSDNIVHINLENGISEVNDTLTIKTIESDINLKQGTYYFKIFNYIAYDGYILENINTNEIEIKAILSNNKVKYDYEFEIKMDKADQILTKNELFKIPFEIKYKGELTNPNVKLALYKKSSLNPINQDYELIDLKTFTEDELNLYINSIYNVMDTLEIYDEENKKINNYELNINTNNIETNGYKFQFQLYDDAKLISTQDKYFIVK